MDILNFISWIKGKRQLNVVDPAKTLLPIGIKESTLWLKLIKLVVKVNLPVEK